MGSENVVETNPVEEATAYLTNEQLQKMAAKCFNRREIKNAVRAAAALATFTNKPLNYELLLKVLHIVEQFDQWVFGFLDSQPGQLSYSIA